jgi:hypothetical protein
MTLPGRRPVGPGIPRCAPSLQTAVVCSPSAAPRSWLRAHTVRQSAPSAAQDAPHGRAGGPTCCCGLRDDGLGATLGLGQAGHVRRACWAACSVSGQWSGVQFKILFLFPIQFSSSSNFGNSYLSEYLFKIHETNFIILLNLRSIQEKYKTQQ